MNTRQQDGAVRREIAAGPAPLEQLRADTVFESADGFRNTGLRKINHLGSAADALRGGDRREGAELTQ
jgi:hypothetical protein